MVNLVAVQGDMMLDAPTANAWRALVAAVRGKHGVTLTITSPGGAYRSDAVVRDMYENKAKYRIPASQPVAKPRSLGGRGSVHENGRCIDIWNHNAIPRASLVALATAHGFRFTIASEPWHVQHDGVTSGGGGAGGIVPTTNKENDMLMVCNGSDSDPNKGRYLIYPTGELPPEPITATQAAYFRKAGVVEGGLEPQQYLWMIEWGKQRFAARQAFNGGGSGGASAAEVAAAVEKILADDFRNVLTAIASVDEATLATFGLQRVGS